MRDVTYSELIDELHKRFIIRIPKRVIRAILTPALNKIWRIIQQEDQEIIFQRGAIRKIFEVHDGMRYQMRMMDINETRNPHIGTYIRGVKLGNQYKPGLVTDRTGKNDKIKIQIFRWKPDGDADEETLHHRHYRRKTHIRKRTKGGPVQSSKHKSLQEKSKKDVSAGSKISMVRLSEIARRQSARRQSYLTSGE